MDSQGVQIVVLCEDSRHKAFAHRVLIKLGFNPHKFRMLSSPPAKGAAEQYVRNLYPVEVKAHRSKASHQNLALILIIDADRFSVDQRHEQLARKLKDQNQEKRSPQERIVIAVPKRNIETWIAFLLDLKVDEEMNCKQKVKHGDARLAAPRFAEWYRNPDARPANALPSILRAFNELDRLSPN